MRNRREEGEACIIMKVPRVQRRIINQDGRLQIKSAVSCAHNTEKRDSRLRVVTARSAARASTARQIKLCPPPPRLRWEIRSTLNLQSARKTSSAQPGPPNLQQSRSGAWAERPQIAYVISDGHLANRLRRRPQRAGPNRTRRRL